MRVLVLGASGATGRQLVRELTERGHVVGAASRRPARMVLPAGAEACEIDPAEAAAVQSAAAHHDAIVNCTGPGGDHAALTAVAGALCATIEATGIRVLHLSSAWSFTPLTSDLLVEESSRSGGPGFLEHRRRSEDALAAAGATVLHLPDFFGPTVTTGPLQYALRCTAQQVPFRWIAERHIGREHLFVPDGMRAVADLLTVDAARGQRIIVPGSGPLTMDGLAVLLEQVTGRAPDCITPSAPETAGFDADFVEAIGEMRSEYEKPVAYDGRRLMTLLPHHRSTPYEVAIPATLESISGGAVV